MKFEYFGITDKGRVRENNEDSYIIDESINFAAVADGMGGHLAGEIASRMAVNITLETLKDYLLKDKMPEVYSKDYTKMTNILNASVEKANEEIFLNSQKDELRKGMGTTLTAILINDYIASIVHIGDSRLYLIRNSEINQITEDDSFIMEQYRTGKITLKETENSPFKNVLTKALGIKKENSYFIKEEKIQPGDILLITTDGLTKMLSDKEILKTVTSFTELNKAGKKLVEDANSKGGEDNITLILIKVINKSLIERIKDIIR